MKNKVISKTRSDLAVYRENAGLTQDDVARVVGLSRNTISNWERGTTLPTLTPIQLKAMCDLLGLSFDDFVNIFIKNNANE